MRQDDYWEKFMGSGKVADYLNFRSACSDDSVQEDHISLTGNCGMEEHAGFSDRYGNGDKVGPGGRI